MADVNVKANVQRTSTLGKVRILVEQVVGSPSQAQINQAVADYIDNHPGALSPLSQATKSALLDIAEHVAYIDANGQSRYDALDAALNAKALLSITAVYTQSGTVYDTDSLDSLKSDLVVTANYDDGTSAAVTGYTLSGELTEGTSTITVTFSGKTTTFNVTVTAWDVSWDYTQGSPIDNGFTVSSATGATQTFESDGYVLSGTGTTTFIPPNSPVTASKGIIESEVTFLRFMDGFPGVSYITSDASKGVRINIWNGALHVNPTATNDEAHSATAITGLQTNTKYKITIEWDISSGVTVTVDGFTPYTYTGALNGSTTRTIMMNTSTQNHRSEVKIHSYRFKEVS